MRAQPGPRPLAEHDVDAETGVVRKLYSARARNDLSAAADLLAPDVIWHEPYDYLGTLNGREAVMDAIRQSMVETRGHLQAGASPICWRATITSWRWSTSRPNATAAGCPGGRSASSR